MPYVGQPIRTLISLSITINNVEHKPPDKNKTMS